MSGARVPAVKDSAQAAALSRSPRLIVCMTSTPPRFAGIARSLDSLLAQSVQPETIFLSIPKAYRRFEGAVCPPDVSAYAGRVVLLRPDIDDGPGTKLIGALAHLPRDPDCLAVLADDDHVYEPGMLAAFAAHFRQSPGEAASFHVYRYRGLDVGQGADGFAIPVSRLRHLERFHRTVRKNAAAFYVDDLWTSYYLWLTRTPIASLSAQLPSGRLIFRTVNDAQALNRETGRQKRSRVMRGARRFLCWRFGIGETPRRLAGRTGWKV